MVILPTKDMISNLAKGDYTYETKLIRESKLAHSDQLHVDNANGKQSISCLERCNSDAQRGKDRGERDSHDRRTIL
jgi:hypothetical protein